MFQRLKAILADFFQQADLVLLGLCTVSTLFGIFLIVYWKKQNGNGQIHF